MATDTRREQKSRMIEDAKLVFRNFTGVEREYNSAGDRNFSVILDPKTAQEMIAEGWRVKQLKARNEDEEGDYHIKVTVNYKKGRPPRCVLLSSRGRSDLGAEEVEVLDVIDVAKADVMINGWWSDMAGGGYGAFLKSIFVTADEDELELKYAQVPDAGAVPADESEDAPWDQED